MNIPPKAMHREVRDRITPARRAGAALDTGRDALPVLGAFGEFLEAERRRTRNRILALTLSFVAVLLLLAGGSFLVGMVFLEQIRADFNDVQRDVRSVDSGQGRLRAETEAAVARLTGEREALARELESQRALLAETRRHVEARAEDYDRELADMRGLVKLLETENTSLKGDLHELNTRVPALVKELAAVTEKIEQVPDAAAAAAVRSGPKGSIELAVLRRGDDRPVAWRLPIPE